MSGATRLIQWTERTQLLRWALLLPGLVCAVGALSTIAVVIVWNHEWSRTARACDPRHIDFEPAPGLPGLLHTSLAVLVAGLVAAATALIYVTYRSARQRGRVMDWEPTIVATVLIVGLLALVYGISSSSDMRAGGETCFA